MEIEFVKGLFLAIGYVVFKIIMEVGKVIIALTLIGLILLAIGIVKAWHDGVFNDEDDEDDLDWEDDDDEDWN